MNIEQKDTISTSSRDTISRIIRKELEYLEEKRLPAEELKIRVESIKFLLEIRAINF